MNKFIKENFLEFDIKLSDNIENIRFDQYLRNFFYYNNNLKNKKLNENIDRKIYIKQSDIEKQIRKKNFFLNGELIRKSNHRILNNSKLLINKNFYENFILYNQENKSSDEVAEINIPKNLIEIIKKSIIYEDENIIVLNKPSGLCVQAGTKILYSIDRILNFIYKDLVIKIIHRLDKFTTGVLIFGKSLEYTKKIANEFKKFSLEIEKNQKFFNNNIDQNIKDDFKKKYILIGKIVCKNNETSKFIKNSEIIVNQKLYNKKIGNEEIVTCDFNNGKNSLTKFKILQVIEIENNEQLYLIEANIFNGRKHQIRAHLSYLGLYIIGDEKYKKFLINCNDNFYNKYIIEKNLNNIENIYNSQKNFFLHSSLLQIKNLNLLFEADFPVYFYKLLK
jgi:23S rRNA pseudouridine955/2504/2580 synthase